MLETYSIKQAFLDGFGEWLLPSSYNFGGPVTLRDGTTEERFIELTGRDILHELNKYTSFGIVYDPETSAPAYSYSVSGLDAFKIMWSDFIRYNQENYNRIVGAYLSEYDPIANYSSRETTTYGATGETTQYKTDQRGKRETYNAPQATLMGSGSSGEFYADQLSGPGEITTTTGTDDAKRYTHTFDTTDTDDYMTDHTTEEPNTTTTTTLPQSAAFEYHSDPETTTTTNGDEHTDTTHRDGNIGVMTSQEMIERELQLRRLNLLQRIVGDFIRDNCITAREVD